MTAKVRIGLVAVALLVTTADQGAAQRQTQPQRQAQAQQPPEWDRIFRSVLPQPDTRAQAAQKKQQSKQQARRAPTRVIVRPIQRYRYDATEFPRTDNLGYPGRNAVRQCRSWLATEYRPSGTVVTPQMRCWWQSG
jgi:hypothetical protein